MNGTFEIPSPEPTDTEDVVSALETADALWSTGNQREAMRLLRTAAEKASDAGDDVRALQLARLAAEIRESARPPANDAAAETDAEPSADEAASAPSATSQHPSTPPPNTGSAVSVSRMVRVESSSEPPPAMAAAPQETFPGHQPPQPSEDLAAAQTSKQADATIPGISAGIQADPAKEPPPETEQRAGGFDPETDPEEPAGRPTPVPGESPSMGARPRTALRVAVLPGVDGEGMLAVRVLADHEIPPMGAHEGLLVTLDADVDLLRE